MANLVRVSLGGSGSVPNGKTVTPINDVTIWQQCAGISNPTYTTLAEVLADTGILQTLMASNNAVDYLVRCTDFKYGTKLIPAMTSNTTPSGIASASSYTASGYEAYKAFDNVDSTYWASNANPSVGEWLRYRLASESVVKWVYLVLNGVSGGTNSFTYKFQGSNDNTNWTDLKEFNTQTISGQKTVHSFNIDNNTAYLYYRLYCTNAEARMAVYTLQFYYDSIGIVGSSNTMYYIGQNNYASNTLLADSDWVDAIANSAYKTQILNIHNPDMTSNTAPSGRCYGSSCYSNRDYYYGFDVDIEHTSWYTQDGSQAGQYLAYEFATDSRIVMFEMYASSNNLASSFKIQKSSDGVTWDDVSEVFNLEIGGKRKIIGSFVNSSSVKCWRIYLMSGTASGYGYSFMLYDCKFYGRKDV